MADTHNLAHRIYAAFNQRDVDTLFAHMRDDVSWPMASEGGRAIGKDAIRDYWHRQWQAFNPHVEPLEIIDGESGTFTVRVRQVVKNLAGDVLSDTEVRHTYTTVDGLIASMSLDDQTSDQPSPAFAHPH